MKYYVVADTHGYYTKTREALERVGYFAQQGLRKLVLCGDAMDRGEETLLMQAFLMEELQSDRLIFVRGNHEDLLASMLSDLALGRPLQDEHISNGTFQTALQLSDMSAEQAMKYPDELVRRTRASDFYRVLMANTVDFYETDHYVFVHGWIPCYATPPYDLEFTGALQCRPDWRLATPYEWKGARRANGMECACILRYGVPDKTTVCGHWHTSYGHAHIEHRGTEVGPDADFSPFRAEGILALDARTALSGIVNCVVLED